MNQKPLLITSLVIIIMLGIITALLVALLLDKDNVQIQTFVVTATHNTETSNTPHPTITIDLTNPQTQTFLLTVDAGFSMYFTEQALTEETLKLSPDYQITGVSLTGTVLADQSMINNLMLTSIEHDKTATSVHGN